MITQEEVKIRLGVDGSQVAPEMGKVGTVIGTTFERSMAKSLRSVKKLLTFNLTSMLLGLAKDLLPTADEFWEMVYGVDAESTKAYEEQNKRLHKLRDEVMNTRKSLEKALRGEFFDKGSERSKQEILFSEALGSKTEADKAKERLKYVKEHKMGAEEIATAQTAVNKAIIEQIKAEKELREFTGKMKFDDVQAQYEAREKMIRAQVYRDRETIFMNTELAKLEREKGNNAQAAQMEATAAAATGRIGEAVAAARAPALGGVSKALGQMPFLGNVSELFKQAQMEVMKDTIQKVSIVEVQE